MLVLQYLSFLHQILKTNLAKRNNNVPGKCTNSISPSGNTSAMTSIYSGLQVSISMFFNNYHSTIDSYNISRKENIKNLLLFFATNVQNNIAPMKREIILFNGNEKGVMSEK